MKFSNGTEFRCGTPKYSRLQARFICIAGGCFLLSLILGQASKALLDGMGSISMVGALVTLLVGTVAERKEWQAAQ